MAKCSRIGELEHLRQHRRRQLWTFLKAKTLFKKKNILNATSRACALPTLETDSRDTEGDVFSGPK